MNPSRLYLGTSLLVFGAGLLQPAGAYGQADLGVKVEKTYGDGLPRDRGRLVYADDRFPYGPLTPQQRQYEAGHKRWGRLPGTSGDVEAVAHHTKVFESLGLNIEHFPYTIPNEWRPTKGTLNGTETGAMKTPPTQGLQ
jgi:hypothetical protein